MAGGGIFDFQNGNSRWPCMQVPVQTTTTPIMCTGVYECSIRVV